MTNFFDIASQFKNWAVKEQPPVGKYAMWWPTPAEPSFINSEGRYHIERTYRAMTGIESYIFTALLTHLGIVSQGNGRQRLPEDLFSVHLKTHEGKSFLFSASREKGLRFHFHIEHFSEEDRNDFWNLFAEYAEGWRKAAEEKGLLKDPESGSLEWWLLVEQAIGELETSGDAPQVVGAIII